eukprot:2042328-Amphidinium_carterae.1
MPPTQTRGEYQWTFTHTGFMNEECERPPMDIHKPLQRGMWMSIRLRERTLTLSYPFINEVHVQLPSLCSAQILLCHTTSNTPNQTDAVKFPL